MRRVPVLLLINSLAGGGAERVMAGLATWLKRHASWDVELVLLDDEPDRYPLPTDLVVHRVGAGKGRIGRLFEAARVIRQRRPRVILSFLTRSCILNVVMSAVFGHRAIVSERTSTSARGTGIRAKLREVAVGLAYRFAQSIVAVSKGVRDDLITLGIASDRVEVIHNAVNLMEVNRLSREPNTSLAWKPYVVAVGRLVSSKRFDLLLAAFARAELAATRLVIVGAGPLLGELEEKARSLGIGERTLFTGYQANPFPALRGAIAYVQSSEVEGFPNGLVEAMALGIPVLATNCRSGPSEILADGEVNEISALYEGAYGLLTPVGSLTEMTEGLKRVTSPAGRKDRSQRALKGAIRYGGDAAFVKYYDLMSRQLLDHEARDHKSPSRLKSTVDQTIASARSAQGTK